MLSLNPQAQLAAIREKGWRFDSAAYETHVQLAKSLRDQGRLTEAFAEQCRALMVLMEAAHRERGRGESFTPFWSPPPPT